MSSWNSKGTFLNDIYWCLFSSVIAVFLWHDVNLWTWSSREFTPVDNRSSMYSNSSFHCHPGTQLGLRFMSLPCSELSDGFCTHSEWQPGSHGPTGPTCWSSPSLTSCPPCLLRFPALLPCSLPSCQSSRLPRILLPLGLCICYCPDVHTSHSHTSFKSERLSETSPDYPSTYWVPFLPTAFPHLKEVPFSLPGGGNKTAPSRTQKAFKQPFTASDQEQL